MSSEKTHPLRAGVTPALAVLLLVSLALGACGKKGDPLPPLRTVPTKTTDLTVRQEGPLLVLNMTYPATTTAGMALDGIEAVELVGLVLPEDASMPDVREIEARAEKLVTLRDAELEGAVTGSRIEIRLPLEVPVPEDVGQQVFAVRTVKGDETSPLSNRATIVPREPPAAPTDLVARAQPDGVFLSWTPPENEEVEAFEVYRRRATERSYGAALDRIGEDRQRFLDRSATYGTRYFYTVRALVSTDPPIQSGPAGEQEVDYQDRFAPPLPTNFVALAEGSRIRLRWDPPDADDVAGVLLWRREPGRDFHLLTEDPVAGTEYLDSGLAMGLSYGYRIQAVDRVGNESELSDPISVDLR